MLKKIIFKSLVLFGICLLITGCYEPTKEEMKTFEERGWIPTIEAESESLKELKKWANIPEDAKIENVSMYGGNVPRVVVYGEMEKWTNYTGKTGEAVAGRKIEIFDESGGKVRTDTLTRPTSISGPLVAKDENGNVTAYKAADLKNNTEKIVFLDKQGRIEKEKELISIEKKDRKGFRTYLEGENVHLSGDGQYMIVNHFSARAYPGAGMEMVGDLNKYKYMDRNENILWEIDGGFFGFDDVKISDDGNRIVIINQQGKDESRNSGLGRGVYVFDKNGNKIYSYLFPSEVDSDGINSIDERGNYIVIAISYRYSDKWGYLHINVDEGKAFISDKKTK